MMTIDYFDIKEELKKLPHKPGVYIMHGPSDEIIYVGKAVSLRNRVRQYFQSPEGKSPKIRKMITLIRRFEYIVVESELEALVLENNLIKENKPKYNTLLKDDKTYPYIKVTMGDAFPMICMTRKVLKDHASYFGPYTNALAVREIIDMLHKLYQIRTCSRVLPRDCGKERPCLYYHLGQCSGPCTGSISREQYHRQIEGALQFLAGKYEGIRKKLTEQMDNASDAMEFEKAAAFRDLLRAVEAISIRQHVTGTDAENRDVIGAALGAEDAVVQVFFIRGGRMVGREHFHMSIGGETETEVLEAFLRQYYAGSPNIPPEIRIQTELPGAEVLSEWLSGLAGRKTVIVVPKRGTGEKLVELAVENAQTVLKKDAERLRREEARTTGAAGELAELLGTGKLHRIESYDISNTSGFDSVGSMIVFEDGRPKNNSYRKFKIRSVSGPDDYASLKEVLQRRFSHPEWPFPELILMDGGRGQVSAAIQALRENGTEIPVAGMVKDDRHRTRGLVVCRGDSPEEVSIDIHGEAFRLITRIQDETHRFAVEYHRSLRGKHDVHSVLDDIPGIGKVRRKSLMKHFTDLESLKQADIETLTGLEGMDRRAAESVYRFFHEN